MELKNMMIGLACLFGVLQGSRACTAAEQNDCDLLGPNCLCPSVGIPGDLQSTNIPQIVYLTFDDAVTVLNYPIYVNLTRDRLNPNGHPITLSFYVTHEYNDYSLVHKLWTQGHDIGLHSISHHTDTSYWKGLSGPGWGQELVDQKKQMAHFAKIPESSIKGFRAPFLQTGGDTMMTELYGNFDYDCSRPTRIYLDPGLWPYTADFDTKFQDCQIEPCAVGSYPGFWNVPMVDLTGGNGSPCAMLDTCLPQPNTTDQALELLKRNFLRHYDGNRAPFGVFTHAAWLSALLPGHYDGYVAFLDYLKTLEDVYIVSVPRALEWVKNPIPLEGIKDFAPWHVTLGNDQCKNWYTCRYAPEDTPGFPSERYMTSCLSCPRKYPWVGNPYGDDIRRGNKFDRS